MRIRNWRLSRVVVAQVIAVGAVLAVSGVAAAISGGDYSPDRMDSTPGAEAYDKTGAEYGCHNLKINAGSGDTRYAEFGIDQTPVDEYAHAFCAAANTGGTNGGVGTECGDGNGSKRGIGAHVIGDINDRTLVQKLTLGGVHRTYTLPNIAANGFDVEFAADDNLSGGEHDGVDGRKETGTDGLQDGPSDGGSIGVHFRPLHQDELPNRHNPLPVLMFEAGSCADGICEDVTTHEHEVHTGGADKDRDAANYDGKEWDPFECDGASLEGEQSCDSGRKDGPKTHKDWDNQEGRVHAQPGVQIYEDPDSAGSPLDPLAELMNALGVGDGGTPLYPLPGFYLGSCGVILNGELLAGGCD